MDNIQTSSTGTQGIDVCISLADNGIVVTAGCLKLVFADSDAFLSELGRYLRDPRKVYKEYTAKYRPNLAELESKYAAL